MKANCPLRFINSVINEFTNGKKDHGDGSFIIPTDLFGITKPFILLEEGEGGGGH